ncbi:MAG: nascent polypeptide-associated complex protein [Nanoarchaeota archaeon]|nr:nascent polypeptide-associated complex protein [Nanoarchaeota archaeon]MBU4242546.1 nascent polypeptide-associated complex protein [Nanoarchaeota archaeon]MBU4352639.1 nascent polypeptide-associated complex protein [Nanoarchaeota archaeon]MBU4456088.1 nascent polypeptide-associated complex protein [Nanoarchaeota archaeon]MCG2719922.1 nascent polypeptide-associated complex protein [Nanoarchaeota archaeon]
MLPNMNPKMMKMAMKKMGIKQEDIEANEVIIKSTHGDLIIKNPNVVKITMGGEDSFQITGIVEEMSYKEDDVKTVAEQAGVSEDKAKEALEETQGDLAEAIMKLTQA